MDYSQAIVPVMPPHALWSMAMGTFGGILIGAMPGLTSAGFLGYFMHKFDFSQAALSIALIRGPMAESNLRLGLMDTDGDVIQFRSSPITIGFLALSLFSLAWPMACNYSKNEKQQLQITPERNQCIGRAVKDRIL